MFLHASQSSHTAVAMNSAKYQLLLFCTLATTTKNNKIVSKSYDRWRHWHWHVVLRHKSDNLKRVSAVTLLNGSYQQKCIIFIFSILSTFHANANEVESAPLFVIFYEYHEYHQLRDDSINGNWMCHSDTSLYNRLFKSPGGLCMLSMPNHEDECSISIKTTILFSSIQIRAARTNVEN